MTPLLERAIARVSELPAPEQDVIAALMLREMAADNRLPFQIPEINDVHEGKGFVYLENEFLVFRFTVVNWGVVEGAWETVKAERALIDGIHTEKGIFKDKLIIDTRDARLLDAIPGKYRGAVLVRTRKQDRAQVEAFVERVRAWMRVQSAL